MGILSEIMIENDDEESERKCYICNGDASTYKIKLTSGYHKDETIIFDSCESHKEKIAEYRRDRIDRFASYEFI